MQKDNLKWCFGLKEGLKLVEPNERISKSYLIEAKASLKRAEKNFQDGDLLWTTVVIYYADYYSLYSFLQRIGLKCENHSCSIMAASFLLGEEKVGVINKHKNKRIDAQYYIKVDKQEEVNRLLKESKIYVSEFDELVSTLGEEEINEYRKQLKEL